MIGWLIVLVGLILLGLGFIELKKIRGRWSEWDLGALICWIGAFIIGLVILIASLMIPQEINEFELYQEMVETSYSETETELNIAMNIQVIEMNTWLASVRASEETYGIFSFYRNKLDDLEYIEIGD